MLAIVDYGAGNLQNVSRIFGELGLTNALVTDPHAIRNADAVVIPGVGAAGSAMAALRTSGMDQAIKDVIAEGRTPVLGICLGLQLLFDSSDEDEAECLGIYRGSVRRMRPNGLKVPHIGWDQVEYEQPHPLVAGIPSGQFFYFAHSFCVPVTEETREATVAWTDYGLRYVSIFARENVVGVQFHPEKSGTTGLAFLRNYVQTVLQGAAR